MGSLWEEGIRITRFPQLEGDTDTDVLIIGGGMAGVLTAFMLKSSGIDYVLCEAEVLGNGVTKNTTAKLTSQHGLLYDKLINEFGKKKAGLYLKANEDALDEYRRLCARIDCDFEEKDNYIYTLGSDKKIEKELIALRLLDFPAERADNLPLPFKVAGAVRFPHQGQFHPLKFLSGISADLNIREHTRVRELKKTNTGIAAVTSYGKIKAKRVIVATHFPFINKHGAYFVKMYQHRSYVIAIENAPDLDGMYLDDNENGLSFRNHKGFLLIGGGSHRTGKKGGCYDEIEAFAKKHFKNANVKYSWAAQDCITLDSAPYIGRYSSRTEGLYVATGFNKWGMTGSMLSAKLLTDLMLGNKNPYEELFSPTRTILRPTLLSNVFESAVGLLTPKAPRCPHLGCALNWNSAEHTWDCPCHGSRFTESGELIDNPATGDLKGVQK